MDSTRTLPRNPSQSTSTQYPPTPQSLPPQQYSSQPQQQYQYSQPVVYQPTNVATTPTHPGHYPLASHDQRQEQQHLLHHHHHHHHNPPPPPLPPPTTTTGHPSPPPPPPPPAFHSQQPISSAQTSKSPFHTQGAPLPPIYSRDGSVQHHSYQHQEQQQPQQQQQQLGYSTQAQPQQSPSSDRPPFRPPSSTQQTSHDGINEHNEHIQGQSRSGHVTPATVGQRLPEALGRQGSPPASTHSARHTAASGLEPSWAAPQQHMDHNHPHPFQQAGPLTNGLHGPHHTTHHEPIPQSYTPTLDPPTAPYAVHGQFAPPQQSVYQPGYGPASYVPNSASGANKRKPMRAQQACEQCRQRKQKCDEGSPCSFCREQGIPCNYRDPGPAKTDKNTERILSNIEHFAEQLSKQTENIERLLGLQASLNNRVSALENPAIDAKPLADPASAEIKPVTQAPTAIRKPAKPEGWSDHRTGAHNLLMLWPSVRPFFNEMREYNSSYVREAEERGILRINGKGQGIEDQEFAALAGPASPTRSDDSHGSAPTPREGLWGRGFIGNKSAEPSRTYGTDGGLLPDGSLDISIGTVNNLFDSFMKHMYIMHPFLDRKRTRRMIDNFISHYSPGAKAKAGFVNGNTKLEANGETMRPMKRQRSEGGGHSGKTTMSTSDMGSRPPLQIEHSPANAIVLLILALGKICQYTDPLPGVLGDKSSGVPCHITVGSMGPPTSSPTPTPFKPSPFSPRSTPNTQPTPPEHCGARVDSSSSRRQSLDTWSGSTAKNIEFIPGLAYYAKAAEIMSGQIDGSELMQAQMFLLAALFKGQLARVKETAKWLFLAGNICYSLIERYKLYLPSGDKQAVFDEVSRRMKEKRVRSILMAAATCLQLEADILAEMSYPPSPIQQIEALMLPPHSMTDDDEYLPPADATDVGTEFQQDINTHHYYTAQLYLRRRLNNAHKVLYGHALRNQSVEQVHESLEAQQREILEWRKNLPDLLSWKDSDPPASNILDARLRAKWYGASYVIHRPFLDYTLHIMPRVMDESCTVEEAAHDAEGNPRDQADIMLFKTMKSMPLDTIWKAARQCIQSALQSTVALDGMKGRLVVTNIHGTAHAQFGNMLVCSAAYNIDYLRDGLVKREQLQPKLERTIRFLRKLAPISPTCAFDCSILERIQQQLFTNPEVTQTFLNEREPVSATTSFSS